MRLIHGYIAFIMAAGDEGGRIAVPKTKLQDLVFSVIMVCLMVYVMTLFNIAQQMGLSYDTMLVALKEMWIEAAIAFFAQRYLAGPFARHIVGSQFSDAAPGLKSIAMAGCNVMIMAPLMTLIVNAMHNGLSAELPLLWIRRLLFNFPFALCMQVFYVGPLARWVFRCLYRVRSAPPQSHAA